MWFTTRWANSNRAELVVMIPNTPVEKDDIIGENYLRSSKFRASGFRWIHAGQCGLWTETGCCVLPPDIDRDSGGFLRRS